MLKRVRSRREEPLTALEGLAKPLVPLRTLQRLDVLSEQAIHLYLKIPAVLNFLGLVVSETDFDGWG